jgi:hypothetical protein
VDATPRRVSSAPDSSARPAPHTPSVPANATSPAASEPCTPSEVSVDTFPGGSTGGPVRATTDVRSLNATCLSVSIADGPHSYGVKVLMNFAPGQHGGPVAVSAPFNVR